MDIHPPRVKALISALDSGVVSSTFGHANAIFLFLRPYNESISKIMNNDHD